MKQAILSRTPRLGALVVALVLGSTLAGCAGVPTNRTMNSIHQPVVEKTNYTLDLATGDGGLPYAEQQRLAGWFEGLGLRYGDRISILDAAPNSATRDAIETVASRYGMAVEDDMPATAGYVAPGTARVVLTRTRAVVHGCPDWSAHSDANPNNALSPNYGCAVNSNMAAMVANPEHLLRGDDATGDTAIMSSNKAISTYRKKEPTGAGALKQAGTQEN